MPIKFRCQHCKQFLGISHLKAGLLVDCPTCGRTIRVPDGEGNVDPLPEPKLNLQDSRLANALNELAALGRGDAAFEPESAVIVAEVEGETSKPPTAAVAPAPIAPPAPVPVRLDPPPPMPVRSIPLEVHDPHKPAAVATMNELAGLANQAAPRDPAAEQPFIEAMPHLNGSARPQSWMKRGVAISWVITIALVTFFFGFIVGRWDRTPNANNIAVSVPPKNIAPVNVAAHNNGAGHKNPAQPTLTGNAPAVRGRITYLTDAGESRPDRGARVLLLPEKREGSTKINVGGLRSADTDADVQIAAASLRALGGEVAVVDESGNFEIGALKPGTYRILTLSHFQPRDKRESIDASLKGILDNFFDRSEQLLGKCRYHFAELKYSGKQTEFYHSFERE